MGKKIAEEDIKRRGNNYLKDRVSGDFNPKYILFKYGLVLKI